MLVEVALLGKAVRAPADQANERLLFRVRTEVIEEIVPFPENAVTPGRMLAEESLSPALALHLEILDIGEGPD